jgi:hypothetical protein
VVVDFPSLEVSSNPLYISFFQEELLEVTLKMAISKLIEVNHALSRWDELYKNWNIVISK